MTLNDVEVTSVDAWQYPQIKNNNKQIRNSNYNGKNKVFNNTCINNNYSNIETIWAAAAAVTTKDEEKSSDKLIPAAIFGWDVVNSLSLSLYIYLYIYLSITLTHKNTDT